MLKTVAFYPKINKINRRSGSDVIKLRLYAQLFLYVFVPIILKLDVTIRLLFNQLFSQLSLIKLHLY